MEVTSHVIVVHWRSFVTGLCCPNSLLSFWHARDTRHLALFVPPSEYTSVGSPYSSVPKDGTLKTPPPCCFLLSEDAMNTSEDSSPAFCRLKHPKSGIIFLSFLFCKFQQHKSCPKLSFREGFLSENICTTLDVSWELEVMRGIFFFARGPNLLVLSALVGITLPWMSVCVCFYHSVGGGGKEMAHLGRWNGIGTLAKYSILLSPLHSGTPSRNGMSRDVLTWGLCENVLFHPFPPETEWHMGEG